MGGKIYRALARNQYLQPIADLFQSIQDQRRREEGIKTLQNLYKQYQGQIGGIDNATEEQTVQQENPAYQPYTQPKPAIPNFNLFEPGKGVTPTAPQNTEMVTRPTFDKKVNVPLSDVQKYNKARELGDTTLLSMFGNPDLANINPNALSLMVDRISRGAEEFRPSFKYETEDPTKRQVKINTRTGKREVISEGEPKRNSKVLDERLDDKGHKIVEYEDQDGNRWTEDKGIDHKFIVEQRRQAAADKKYLQLLDDKITKQDDPDVIKQDLADLRERKSKVSKSSNQSLYNSFEEKEFQLQRELNKAIADQNRRSGKPKTEKNDPLGIL